MKFVRDLINSAYRQSTTRGLGDVADDLEADDALDTLNGHLAELAKNAALHEATKAIHPDIVDGYFTFGNRASRKVVSALAEPTKIQVVFGDAVTDLVVGEHITLRLKFPQGWKDFDGEVSSVDDQWTVTLLPIASLSGSFHGSWKKATEGREFLIDVLGEPPTEIDLVTTADKSAIGLATAEEFYTDSTRTSTYYYYEKSAAPYPRVYVSGELHPTVVYPESIWHNWTLDTCIDSVPRVIQDALQSRLASEIAYTAGYDNVGQRLEKRADKLTADFIRSQHEYERPEPDRSAPGYGGHIYNIYKDA